LIGVINEIVVVSSIVVTEAIIEDLESVILYIVFRNGVVTCSVEADAILTVFFNVISRYSGKKNSNYVDAISIVDTVVSKNENSSLISLEVSRTC